MGFSFSFAGADVGTLTAIRWDGSVRLQNTSKTSAARLILSYKGDLPAKYGF